MIDLYDVEVINNKLSRLNTVESKKELLVYTHEEKGTIILEFSKQDTLMAERLTTNNHQYFTFLLNLYKNDPEKYISAEFKQ